MTPLESGPKNPNEHENDIIHLDNEMSKGLSQIIRHYRLPGHPGAVFTGLPLGKHVGEVLRPYLKPHLN